MLKNYLLTTIRVLTRNRLFFFINTLGLAVGLATFLMAYLFIRNEISYDKFHPKHERIFRVVGSLTKDIQSETPASCVFGLGPSMINDYPLYVDKAVRFFNFQDPQHTLTHNDKVFNDEGIFLADSTVFEVFNFPLLKGDPLTALDEPHTIVITEDLAKKFKQGDAMGKVLRFDNSVDLKVTGILKPVPNESHIHFNALVSFSTVRTLLGSDQQKNWVWNPCWTYLLLKDGIDPERVNQVFPEFVQKHYPEHMKTQVKHVLQPLTDIHLQSKLDFEIEPNNDERTLYIFGVIGFFVLIIAIINFTNLSTARSVSRAREIGIRKAAGAQRKDIVLQFLTESLLIAFVAFIFSLAFMELFLPLFNHLSGKQLDVSSVFHAEAFSFSIATTILTGLLAGAFPAFYISALPPLISMKNAGIGLSRKFNYQKALVVCQFTITSCLLVSTGMVYYQLQRLQRTELGFDKEQLLMIPTRPPMTKSFEPFMEEVKHLDKVSAVTIMNDVLGKKHNNHEYNFKDMRPGDWAYYPTLMVDEQFIKTMNMKLVAGRDYDKYLPREDTFSIIINEAMAAHMGWTPADAIGKRFNSLGGSERVIGVVKDFNFVSLLSPIKPFVLDIAHPYLRKYWTRYIAVRLKPGDHSQTIAEVEKIWKQAIPGFPFQYFFLDDELNKQYQPQQNIGRLTAYFSVIAIFIACLGIFALSSFKARQRSKEIAIRKVLGGDKQHIVLIITRPFMWLVVIANCIAIPLSYYLITQWQQQFAYKADFDYLLFLWTFIITLVIAYFTLYFKVRKIVRADSVDYLRSE